MLWFDEKIYLTYICICGRSEGGDPKWGSPHNSRKKLLTIVNKWDFLFIFQKNQSKYLVKKEKEMLLLKYMLGHTCAFIYIDANYRVAIWKKYLVMVCDIVIRFFYKSTQQWYLLPPIYIKNLTTIFLIHTWHPI